MSIKIIKTNVKFNEGKCPLCGGELEYIGPRDIDDSGSTVPWHCTQCGACGNEGYTDMFTSHYRVQDADGCDVVFVPLPVEPLSDDNLLCEAGDVIDNAAFDLLSALSSEKLEWDMQIIGEVVDVVEGILKRFNIPYCRPWQNENEHICYALPNERCAHCPRQYVNVNGLSVAIHGDSAIPMSIYDDVLRVDWYNADEGISGDYDPDDPDDINLLRFDVYVKGEDGEWLEVEDASYCTNMPATASEDVLEAALHCIFRWYRTVIKGPDHPSVKRLGEELSHISEDDFTDDTN